MLTKKPRMAFAAAAVCGAFLLTSGLHAADKEKTSKRPTDKLPDKPAPAPAVKDSLEEAAAAFERGDHATVIALLTDELKKNPGHEEAYILLAKSQEAKGDKDAAAKTWGLLRSIARTQERLQLARLGLLRTRGPEKPKFSTEDVWEDDPYKVDIGKVDWDKLKSEVDGVNVQYVNELPPVEHESPYFDVLACTPRTAEVINHLCEKYTEFLLKKYFYAGQEWALKLPILIFKNHADYVSVGHFPNESAGATRIDIKTGVPRYIGMYMLDDENKIDRDAFEGTLPHEITHMVLHEWFGGRAVPRWIDEGLARRMEQSRKHYLEAAKVGRDAAAGEYYRFRSLFEQEQYPTRLDRTFRFYEQSATIVLFLLEQYGPESAVAFFEALRQGKTQDEATAGALGIPVEGAVEEFEKRWADWARKVYYDRRAKIDGTDIAQGTAIDDVAVPTFDEVASANASKTWKDVKLEAAGLKDVGGSLDHWKIDGGKLACNLEGADIGSLVGLRFDAEAPYAFRFKASARKASFEKPTLLGVAMLDHRGDDTGIQVLAEMEDRRPRQFVCVVTDEIALYIDGICCGRAPALRRDLLKEDVDWPLAFVGYEPVEISDVAVTQIKETQPLQPPSPSPSPNP